MFNKHLLSIALFASIVGARIQVPFTGIYDDEESDYVELRLSASVGTPEQKFQFKLASGPFYYTNNLYVRDSKSYNALGFDSSKSSTFVKVGDIQSGLGTDANATETVKLGDTVLTGKPITMVYKTPKNHMLEPQIGVDRYTALNFPAPCPNQDCTTFVQSVVRTQKEQLLVLYFEKIPGNLRKSFKGQLVFGERPDDLCQKDWTFLPEIPQTQQVDKQWAFNVSTIAVGKYGWKNIRNWAVFDLNNPGIFLPKNIYFAVMKVLGGDGETLIPCGMKTEIVLNLAGRDISITPDMYTVKEDGGGCSFNGGPSSDDNFYLPITVLSEYCLAFDYKNDGLQIVKRVHHWWQG